MVHKENFRKAFENLRKKDASIVKETITRRCGWGSFQLFYMKMRGDRTLQARNQKKVDEISVVETTFRAFGIDAWTGNELVTV